VLGRHGLTLDPATGEVAELEPFNAVMSKRGEQVRRNLERLETDGRQAHPGETMGPVVTPGCSAEAWAHERPAKKPTTLREEAAWVTELREAGYDPERVERKPAQPPVLLDDLAVQEIASRALDRCAAGASAWTPHTVQEHVTRITTEARRAGGTGAVAGVHRSGDRSCDLGLLLDPATGYGDAGACGAPDQPGRGRR
jgi:hypothetical protein